MSGIDVIIEVLQTAECKVLLDRNCFFVSLTDFYRIQEIVASGGMQASIDDKLQRQLGLVNLEIRTSPKEKRVYYIVAEAEPILDEIWNKNFKGEKQ